VSRAVALVSLIALHGGCDLLRDPGAVRPDAAAGVGPDGWPAPNGDLVPPVGSAATLDVATWNLENFPKAARSIALAADLIASLDLDVIVVEEVASITAWDELVARLPDHGGVLSSHRYGPDSYQKIGVLYREDLVTASPPELLFTTEGYTFPRPPLVVHLTVDGAATIDVIGVHLKAGTTPEDRSRRAAAVNRLDTWMRDRVDTGAEDELILLGDFNATLDPARPDLAEVWPPLVGAPARYTVHTIPLEARGEASYLPAGILLDHIVTTAGLAAEVGGREAVIPDLATLVPRYDADLTDHLPVVLSLSP
jgi:endonuclease/exonuclease/phosphatase family metal-dependent hydrolase